MYRAPSRRAAWARERVGQAAQGGGEGGQRGLDLAPQLLGLNLGGGDQQGLGPVDRGEGVGRVGAGGQAQARAGPADGLAGRVPGVVEVVLTRLDRTGGALEHAGGGAGHSGQRREGRVGLASVGVVGVGRVAAPLGEQALGGAVEAPGARLGRFGDGVPTGGCAQQLVGPGPQAPQRGGHRPVISPPNPARRVPSMRVEPATASGRMGRYGAEPAIGATRRLASASVARRVKATR